MSGYYSHSFWETKRSIPRLNRSDLSATGRAETWRKDYTFHRSDGKEPLLELTFTSSKTPELDDDGNTRSIRPWSSSTSGLGDPCAGLSMETATEVNLPSSRLWDRGASSVADFIRRAQRIRTVRLPSNNISVLGAESLAFALSSAPHLTHLDLSGNRISNAGLAALARGLAHAPALTILRVAKNFIREEGVQALALAMSSTPNSITELDLSGNFIQSTGAKALERLLAQTAPSVGTKASPGSHITALDVSSCYLKTEGVCSLASALAHSTSIISLRIGDNLASLPAANALRNMLCTNNTLIDLDISSAAGDSDHGAWSLSSNLDADASTSFSIGTGSEWGGAPGLAAICEGIEGAQVLYRVSLRGFTLPHDAVVVLSRALKVGERGLQRNPPTSLIVLLPSR